MSFLSLSARLASPRTRTRAARTWTIRSIAASALLGLWAAPASAQPYNWDTTKTGPQFWNDPTNWSPNTAFPNDPAAIANLINGIGAATVIDLGQAITVNQLNFTNSNAFSYNVTGGANVLTFGGTAPALTATGGGTGIIAAQINTLAALAGTVNNGSTLQLTNTANTYFAGSSFAVGNGTTTGALTVTASNLTGTSASALGTAAVNLNGGTFTVNQSVGALTAGVRLRSLALSAAPGATIAAANFDAASGAAFLTSVNVTAVGNSTPTVIGGYNPTNGTTPNFPNLAVSTNFAARYSGVINLTTGGIYTFDASSDDNTRLLIDGTLVVNNDAAQGVATRFGSIALGAGLHKIELQFAQGGGGASVLVPSYITPFGQRTTIPSSALFYNGTVDLANDTATVDLGTPVTVAAGSTSTLNLAGTQSGVAATAAFGTLTIGGAGTTTLVTTSAAPSSARFTGTTIAAGTGTVVFNVGAGADLLTGAVSQPGTPNAGVTYLKTGGGSLILDQVGNDFGTGATITVQGGSVTAFARYTGTATPGSNPLGTATVNLSGGNLQLGSTNNVALATTNNYTFDNQVNVTANATVFAVPIQTNPASGAQTGPASVNTLTLGSGAAPVTLSPGVTLTLALPLNYNITQQNNTAAGAAPTSLPDYSRFQFGGLAGDGTTTLLVTGGVATGDNGSGTGQGVNTSVAGGQLLINSAYSGFAGNLVVGNGTAANGYVRVSAAAGATSNLLSGFNSVGVNTGALLDVRANGTGSFGTVTFASNVVVGGTLPAAAQIQVANNGANVGNTVALGNLTIGGQTLAPVLTNGYALAFTGTSTFTGTPTFFVTTPATASNVLQGLSINGQITGAGFGLVKTGAGTLVLGNTSVGTPNTFGGAGTFIDVTGGAVAAASDAGLGAAGTGIRLNGATSSVSVTTTNASTALTLTSTAGLFVGQSITGTGIAAGTTITAITSGTTATLSANATAAGTVTATFAFAPIFRANSTFSTGKTVLLNTPVGAATNVIEVTSGPNVTPNILTLTTGLTVSAATNTLTKNDNGVLELAGAATGTWTGPVTINAGAIRASNAAAFGATTNVVSISPNVAAVGAALQLSGGITLPNAITLQGNNNVSFGGLNFGGQLQSVSGTNTVTGVVSLPFDAAIGADAGATLNINGGINNATTTGRAVTFTGNGGTINVNSNLTSATTPTANQFFGINKYGSSTLNFTTAVSAIPTNNLTVFAGTMAFTGAGTLTGGNTIAATVNPNATLTLDNATTTNVANRLGGRPVTLVGGNLNYMGNGAATSSEVLGAAVFSRGQSTVTVTAGAGQQANLTFASINNAAIAQNGGTAPTGASVLFRGTNLGSAIGAGNASITSTAINSFPGSNTAAGTTGKGVIPFALIDASPTGLGTSFATADAAGSILRPLAASELETLAGGAALTNTNTNKLITGAVTASAAATTAINSLTFATGTTSLAINPRSFLTNGSGGVLVLNGGTASINGGIVSAPNTFSPLTIHTVGTASLTITSLLTGGNGNPPGLVKAADGTLTLSTPTATTIAGLTGYSANTANWQTTVNRGTLALDGGTNTLAANTFLQVGAGGTLDLRGNAQYVSGLFTDGTVAGSGGTVTSTTGTGTLVANSDARTFAGTITGNVYFNKTGSGATTLVAAQTYTGGTLLNGNTTTLQDGGAITASSGIDLNFATLTLNNNNQFDSANRVGDTIPLTLRGGALNFTGRAQAASTETIGAVTVAQGYSVFTVAGGGTGVNSADLTIASLSRVAGSGATFNVNSAVGLIGTNPRLFVTAAPTLTNNIIGGWAIVQNEFATNGPLGLIGLNNTGGGAVGYDFNNNTIPTGSNPNANVRLTATTAVPTGGATLNALSLSGSNIALTFTTGTDTLNLTSGGLIGPNNNQTIGATVDSGRLTAGGLTPAAASDLYVFNRGNTLTINSRVVNNASGGGSAVRLVLTAAGGNITLANGSNSYTGGTIVSGGSTVTLNSTTGTPVAAATDAANGLVINGSTVTVATTTTTPQIAAANVVTLNGNSTLNLFGNTTLAGLAFNNIGGGNTTPTVNTFQAGTAAGTLTIGAAGITATGSNVGSTSLVQGRVDFGASNRTVAVDTILVNGVDVAPLQANLAIQGIAGSAGGITKTGLGVLQFNAPQVFTGTVTVAAGGVQFGVGATSGLGANNQPGSRFATYDLAAGTRLNLNNGDVTIGGLSGSGNVINAINAGNPAGRTLNVGFNNASTTFAGGFLRFNDSFLNPYQVNKIGTGTLTLTGASTTTGALQVSQGGVTFSGATGTGVFGTYLALPTGTLTLDNSGTNVNNRLGGTTTTTTLGVVGGEVVITGNALAATTETVGTLSFNTGTNPNGASVLTLQANAAQPLTLTVGTAFGAIGNNTTGLIRGVSGTAGSGLANVNLGAIALGAPAGTGTGANGTTTMAIRPDLLGDASAAGTGTGFITKDTTSNFLRPLTAAELAPTYLPGQTNTAVNYGLSTALGAIGTTTVGSLTLNSGGGVANDTGLTSGFAGLPVRLTINTGGVLANAGNTGLNVSQLSTGSNAAFYFHTLGNLTVGSSTAPANLLGTSGGLVKADAGTLTLFARGLYTGNTVVNGGTLTLSGGDNTLPVFVTAGAPTAPALGAAAGTIDLNGTSQIVGTLFTNGAGRYANTGGTVTNLAGGGAVTLTTNLGSAQAFGGVLAGNLNFTKTGNNALTLTSPNTYTGVTTVRANTLTLIDAGSLATSAVNVNFGGLALDNSGLNPVVNPTRLAATVPVTLTGGALTITSGASADYSTTINTVTAAGSHNTVTVSNPTAGFAATSALSVGNLVVNADSTVNLAGGNGGFFNTAPSINTSNLFITQLNGVDIPATITNKILGGNILVNNQEFATYVQGGTAGAGGVNYGVITMNGIAAIGQTQYEGATVPTGSNPTQNIRIGGTGTQTIAAGGSTINALAVRAALTNLNFTNAADTLNLVSGGLALTNGGTAVGVLGTGRLTAGGTQSTGTARLYIYSSGASNTINAAIVDNPNGAAVRVVLAPLANALTIAGSNTYTGGTVINGGGGTVSLTSATGTAVSTGGLTINNAAVTQTVAGNIAAANDVTLNGGGTLALAGINTLNSLTFNNTGGTGNPAVTLGTTTAATTSLTLTAGTITAVNDNVATTPTISAGGLTLSGAAPTVTTSGVAPTSLVITSPISAAAAVTKAGTGSVVLNPNVTVAVTNTSGSNSLTGLVNTAGVFVGQVLSGTGIAAGTTVTAVGGTTVTMSANSTANATSVTFSGSTFTGGVNLTAGSILLGQNSVASTVGGTVTAGPLGTGTLTVSDGTALMSDTAVRTVANAVVLDGNVTFGSLSNANGSALAVNGVTLNGTFSLGGATRTINVNSVLNTSTIGGVVSEGAAVAGITKTGPGILVLTGANTFTGAVAINGGTLQSNATGLGSGGAISFGGGILQHAASTTTDFSARFATTAGQPFYIDSGANTVTYATALDGGAGGSVGKFGSGTLILRAAPIYDSGTEIAAGTLQIGTGATSTGALQATTFGNAVVNGTLVVNRLAAETFTTGSVTGTGGLTVDQGTAKPTGVVNLAGNLGFGSAASVTTTGTLDLTTANTTPTFGGLLTQNNNTTGSTVTTVAGQTLTINGNVVIGTATPAVLSATNKLTIGGGGLLNAVTAAGGLFQVGGNTAASNTISQNSVLDLTGLASATINVSATGTVRVNQPTGTNAAGNQSSLLLPTPTTGVTATTPVTTITAGTFSVGDNGGNGGGAGQTNAVTLGTGLTTLNVNTVNVGTGGRDFGQITFAAGNGTIRLRAADGTSAAAFNVGTGVATTGVATPTGVTNNVDFTGHSADLLISTLAIGAQNRLVNRTDTVAVDTGSLTATTVVIGTNTGTASTANGAFTPTWTSNLNVGGGTASIGNGGVDIGFGQTATTSGAQTGTKTLVGNFNVSGGAVTVANNATFGAAIRMSNNTIASALVANSNVNVTGGSLTLAGNIVKGLSTGAGTATVTVAGGTLDLGNNSIGASGALVNLTLSSGQLRNVLEVNGGGTVTKATGGTLIMAGTNAYTGATNVTAGTLLVNGTNSGAAAVTVSGGATLGGTGSLAGATTVDGVIRGGTTGGSTATAATLTVNNAVNLSPGGTILTEASDPTQLGTTADASRVALTAGAANRLTLLPTGTGSFTIDLRTSGATPLISNQPYSITLATVGTVGNIFLGTNSVPNSDPGFTGANVIPSGNYNLVSGDGSLTSFTNVSLQVLPNGLGGDSLVLSVTATVIPEPATVGLLATLGLGLGRLFRRRRPAAQ